MPLTTRSLSFALVLALAVPVSAQTAQTEARTAAELAHLRTLIADLDLRAAPATARLAPRARAEARVAPPGGATFVVTTAADAGPGSLREAIERANATPERDYIDFAIDGGGSYQEIFLQSNLPLVTAPIWMDGDTQGCDTDEGQCIRLDGAALVDNVGVFDHGLTLAGGGSNVYGIVFTRFFAADPISALGLYSSFNLVMDCYFGTDRTGSVTDPDGVPGSGDELGNGFGLAIASYPDAGLPDAASNLVGSSLPDLEVIVAGSTFSGVGISERGSDSNLIEGVYTGTNPAGAAGLGNGQSGVVLGRDVRLNTLSASVISGNFWDGVTIQRGASDNTVTENLIGTDPTGMAALPNGTPAALALLKGIGVTVLGGSGNTITNNVVSGNLLAGIALGSANGEGEAEPAPIADNVVAGNLIGTDASGTSPIPNGVPGVADVGFGVVFFAGANVSVTGNVIGGADDELVNVIAHNTSAGIGAEGPGVVGNVVDGNLIGLNADGEAAPNGQVGILFRNGPNGNRIGTDALGGDAPGNMIANQTIGVAFGAYTGGNDVLYNTFAGQPGAYLPVDLGVDGPTMNDAGDPDEGPNRVQNAPEILSVTPNGADLTVRYRVDTEMAHAAYPLTVRFYGQGLDGGVLYHVPVGSATYEAPGEASATFANPFDGPAVVVATATDAAGNTGEATLQGVPVSAGEAVATDDGVRVGPNPTAGPFGVRFALASPGEAALAVYDVLGREVASTAPARLGAGPQRLAVDAALPAGVYVWRLTLDGRTETGRVTVVR